MFCQTLPYKAQVFLAGTDYFSNVAFEGWNNNPHRGSDPVRNIYVYDDSAHGFVNFMSLRGACRKVSANELGNRLAVIQAIPGKEHGENVLSMWIFDADRKKIIDVNNVYDFKWLRNDSIVFVSGSASEDNEIGGFSPTGTWILSLRSKKPQKIFDEGYWISVDERSHTIYIDNYWKVYAFDYSIGVLHETKLNGNCFSPNGKYYYRSRSVYWPFVLYEASSNRPVKVSGIDSSAEYALWLNQREETLVAGNYYGEKKIIDVGTSKTLGYISGKIIGFTKERNAEAIVIKDKRHFKSLSASKVEKIKLN